MAHWLYNSAGNPIAFVASEEVFSAAGQFIGRLEDNEVWNGTYIGEIVGDDLLLRRIDHLAANRIMPKIWYSVCLRRNRTSGGCWRSLWIPRAQAAA